MNPLYAFWKGEGVRACVGGWEGGVVTWINYLKKMESQINFLQKIFSRRIN